nr:hypothetical protein [Tanacetum cinerariifolium]
MEALIEDENALDKGVTDTVKDHKRKHDDDEDDDDEDPPARPNQGKKTKRSRTKEYESSKKPSSTKKTPKGKAPTKGCKIGKSVSTKEPVEEPIAEVIIDDADKLDWNNPEVDCYPFDISKPLPLQGSLEVTYITSIMKTKAARYEIKGIEGMAILGVKSVSVKKLHGYGYFEKIMVKRSNQQLYKFKEGNFVDLHLNDIEDMLLLAVQHKLFHLDESDIVDFIVALRMFTRTLILKRRIKDLQLV